MQLWQSKCFVTRLKNISAAYAAALGGLDILVFSGGIGENAVTIRTRICEDLKYMGIQLNQERNSKNELQISANESTVKVYVIPTNEELMIAKSTAGLV